MSKDLKAMDEFLGVILNDDKDLVKVTEPINGCVYHISSDKKIKTFVPMVSNRTLIKEDRRVPRICSAETLWGCFLGYAATVDEFYNLSPGDWRGGYYIYKLPCDLIVTPSKKLLPDVKRTDETWVVGYNEKHQSIVPEIIGKCFFYSVTFKRTLTTPIYDIVAYIHIKEDMAIMDVDTKMASGYYKLSVSNISDATFWQLEQATLTLIDKAEWDDCKKLAAGTLSFDSSFPSAGSW
jgi:hypothetical protein